MENNKNADFMHTDRLREVYSRFGEGELSNQKDDVVVYVLTELCEDKVEDIMKGVKEIKNLTGMDLNLDAALLIRRLAQRVKSIESVDEKSDVHHSAK